MATVDSGLTRYSQLLYEANKQTNLVSRRLSAQGVRDLVHAHAELLVRAGYEGSGDAGGLSGTRLIDVGSGGGLPGIPLKLRHPEIHVVLAESRRLRAACLRAFVEELGLEAVDVATGDATRTQHHGDERSRFDIATAFGVGQAIDVIGLLSPLLRHDGIGYISIPSTPAPKDVARWHLEAAARKRGADVLEGVLPGGRSVLRLRPLDNSG